MSNCTVCRNYKPHTAMQPRKAQPCLQTAAPHRCGTHLKCTCGCTQTCLTLVLPRCCQMCDLPGPAPTPCTCRTLRGCSGDRT
jgi:hypothetical protein